MSSRRSLASLARRQRNSLRDRRRTSRRFHRPATSWSKGLRNSHANGSKLVQDHMRKNIDGMNRLASCHSLQDFVTVQSDIARDWLSHTVESSRRLAEVSLRVADEAARVIQSQAGRDAGEMERNLRRVS